MKINWRYMKHTRKSQITNNISTSCPVVHILSTMGKKEKLVKIAGSSRHQQCLHKKISWIVGWLRRIARTRQWVVWCSQSHFESLFPSEFSNLPQIAALKFCVGSIHHRQMATAPKATNGLPPEPLHLQFMHASCAPQFTLLSCRRSNLFPVIGKRNQIAFRRFQGKACNYYCIMWYSKP